MNLLVRAILIILIIYVIRIAIQKRKQKSVEGLGKASLPSRPPKLRIVYSKKQNEKDRRKISSSSDAFNLFQEIWSKQMDAREEMIVLLLDRSNRVLGYHTLSMGGITGTVADLRLLFSVALKSLSTAFILAHNHPSGNLNPSNADIELTKKIKEAGNVMDINLLDHIIMTRTAYFSFTDEGAM